MRSAARYSALAGVLALGIASAFLIQPEQAHAYSIGDLPSMGFGVVFISLPENGCHGYRVGWHNDNKTNLGSDCDPGFQDKLDAFMASHCPPYVCPELATTATVTTAITTTQTTTATVTLPQPPPVTTAVTTTVAVVQPPPPDDDPEPAQYVAPSPPSASFADQENALTVNLTDTSGNQSVTWSFGDGANGAGSTVTHTFTAAGNYTIIETVIDEHGLAAQAAQTVNVTPAKPPSPARLMDLLR